MNYADIQRDYIRRSIANLNLIETIDCDAERFEVTQLLNSLFGIIVVVRERLFKYTKQNLRDVATPRDIQYVVGVDNGWNDLIVGVRTAIAHVNVQIVDRGGEISGVVFHNLGDTRQVVWKVEITIEAIRELLDKIAFAALQNRN